ncbi:integrin beta-3-like, partial [Brachionus plicatilis]
NDPSRISGKYCECDNESCDRYLSVVCAGNGRCECGICKCFEGWTKSDCSCSTNNSSCISSNGLVCNGKGQCVCGKCVCDEDSGYFGRTCEDCPTCPLPCENNRDCVQCKVFGTGKKTDCDQCDIELEQVDRIDQDSAYKQCQFNDLSDNCTFFFSYEILNDKKIRFTREKDCPSSFPTWAIILIIVSSVLFIGLGLLIIWKILDTMQQKRECARFNEEKKKAAWETSENPLYKSATSKFVNPSYKDTKIN